MMQTDSRRQKHLDRTRKAIAEAARDLFRERGFHATTIDDIAERADIAPRTFFRYFPTKESLLLAHGEEKLTTVRDRVLARPLSETPVEAIVAVLREGANDMAKDREWCTLICQLISEDPSLLEIQRRGMIDSLSVIIAEALAERSGEREPSLGLKVVAAATVATVATAIQGWIDGGAEGDIDADIEEALRAIRAALA